ncbi:olfactory receptor 6C75-like [Thamnophis elegans]|uniref:olfactory receptor 6C75-like n=1 Tax=Thamnophis elegans TaxID=35005 RepID=UPI0013772DFE|nr:olfactory receptor 6C75-like [Thamnophis elegans]
MTFARNVIIIILVIHDPNLHIPMYFFLGNLSVLEILITTSIIPKILVSLLLGNKSISYPGCLSQCYFFFFLGSSDFVLLTVMSYDRYMAICNPLQYPVIMRFEFCLWLVIGCYAVSFFGTILPTNLVTNLSFCGRNQIGHFFCDSLALMKLACTDLNLVALISFFSSSVIVVGSLISTIISYVNIITVIVQIPSSSGRQRAFSTCSSHLIVDSLEYSSCIFMYVQLSGNNPSTNKIVSLINIVLTPLLSPFIFSLRNKQMKDAVKTIFIKHAVY